MTALGKSDYAAAIGLFAEARPSTRPRCRRRRPRRRGTASVPACETNVDQAHAVGRGTTPGGLAAEADKVARDVFDQAQAKQVEGDGLVKPQQTSRPRRSPIRKPPTATEKR